MTIRLHADPRRHRLAHPDADPRTGWTHCGIRFAWCVGRCRCTLLRGERCAECWA